MPPATLGPVNSPPPASTGSSSENSDNSDSESSSRGSEDGPPPLLPQDGRDPVAGVDLSSAGKGALRITVNESSFYKLYTVNKTAAIPLSVVQTSNKDPVLTTALLPHSEFCCSAA